MQRQNTQTPQWALEIIRKVKDERTEFLDLNAYSQGKDKLIFVPTEIFDLSWLQMLDLRSNEITSIPETITNLKNLRWLDLRHNELTSVGHWIVKLPKLNNLYLHGNTISIPPPEVLNMQGPQDGRVDLSRLRAYLRQQVEVGEERLYEAKLLIVGEPGAGKTSLTRKLLNPSSPLPTKGESTEGIDVQTWTFPVPEEKEISQNNTISKFRVNIWDFGGQEIYHATHQFFLSRRSLYIVVADAREQKTNFFHWLDLIEHLSDRSPVLIFNNEIQNRHWAINEQQLQAHFPDTFQKPFAFNLANDDAGLAHLRHKIQKDIVTLPHVGDVLPRTWVNVRRALENDNRSTVTLQEFLLLCRDNGFTRTEDALQLSSYLHDIGVLLHFQDDPLLKRTVILKPEWGTDAVYRVLDDEKIETNQGHFDRDDLRFIWHEAENTLLHDELLALMMKFQLCYAIPGQKERYIAPQLLSEQPPTYKWGIGNNLHLRYKYETFMPKGLLTRFIVAMHPFIAQQQLVWRSGVVLFKDNTAAEVTEYYPRGEIRIRVAGKRKRDMLAVVTYELDKLHRPFHGLKYDRLIPCNCTTCRSASEPNFYRLDILKTRLEYNRDVIECDKPPFAKVQIRPLLDDIGATIESTDLPTLLQRLNRAFSDDEFRTLCFDLGVDYDSLPGEGLDGKQRELLLFLQRNGRLPELINLLRQKRPNFNW